MSNGPPSIENETGLEIAIVGMAGRFPGARNLTEFWRNLQDAVESISFFDDEQLRNAGVSEELLGHPDFIKARGVVDDPDAFDAALFGYSPREAELLDPQHRLFLECCWEALEDAGYGAEHSGVGVYGGASRNTYLINNVYTRPDILKLVSGLQTRVATDNDFLATRVSYKLDLDGPSLDVQTACSTSLVAIHLACQGLLSGACDLALAGGVSVILPLVNGYFYVEGGILSPDGHCRAFDAAAGGTVGGSGVGVIVLKRLEEARAAGDSIRAIIRGTAINNDGAAKVGFTAPSVEGQAKVVRAAQAMAGILPDSVSYIEAHGTGTPLGDPIEIAALTKAFRVGTSRRGFCAIGSVKTNIGHLDSAAGIAGIIKTTLALQHRMVPPSLNYEEPNPKIDFADSPFFVNVELRPWESDRPRRAGVSSFGMGGTNAHVVIEEALPPVPSGPSRRHQLLSLSARSKAALVRASERLAEQLEADPSLPLADVCFTLHRGRRLFEHRRVLLCRDTEEARRLLLDRDLIDAEKARIRSRVEEERHRQVGFFFPGQGSQHVDMGRGLYEGEEVFRRHLDRCAELLEPHLTADVRSVLYPADVDRQSAEERLQQTAWAQPALFTVEYALARLWMSWGLEPAAMIGHSIGEIVAACLAGVLELEDAAHMVAVRGRLMQEMPPGAMLSVALPESEVTAYFGHGVELAAANGPSLSVVAGPIEAVEKLAVTLAEAGIDHRRLHTSHAFHTAMMDPALPIFAETMQGMRLAPPKMAVVSNVTGEWLSPEQATDPNYWVEHLRRPVLFAKGAASLLEDANLAVLEVGPGQALTTLVRQMGKRGERPVCPSMRKPREQVDDGACLVATLGDLWLSGVQVDWSGYYGDQKRRRVPLPAYPFERRSHWIAPGDGTVVSVGSSASPAVGRRPLGEWFYLPSWRRSLPRRPTAAPAPAPAADNWLLLVDLQGVGDALASRLRVAGQHVVTARVGEGFRRLAEESFEIAAAATDQVQKLFDELAAAGRSPTRIVHLWSLDVPPGEAGVAQAEEICFHSQLALARILGQDSERTPAELCFVTAGLWAVSGQEDLRPAAALGLGPMQVIPQEVPWVRCRCLDVDDRILAGVAAAGNGDPAGVPASARIADRLAVDALEHLAGDLLAPAGSADEIVALRGPYRWVQDFEPAPLEPAEEAVASLRPEGVYLITGGLGGIGLTVAGALARSPGAKLALLGRSNFPDRSDWAEHLATHDAEDPRSRQMRSLMELEEAGAEIQILSADVGDLEEVRRVVARVVATWGTIHGVVHSAGVPGGGMIQRKTVEEAARVMSPKVRGTVNLTSALPMENLDFFVLCSSLSAVVGGFGQSDYAAANAFQDAFAHFGRARYGWPVVSVNWDAWLEVGMAAQAVPQSLKGLRQSLANRVVEHPLLDECSLEMPEQAMFLTRFRRRDFWVIDEHRIAGFALLPGTAYLEMARAALMEYACPDRDLGGAVEISEVAFRSPCIFDGEETREVETWLREQDGAYHFEISSRQQQGAVAGLQHASGRIRWLAGEPIPTWSIEAWQQASRGREIDFAAGERTARHGPRWRSLETVQMGESGRYLARLALPGSFAADLQHYALHPAVLDVATSFPVRLIVEGEYLPLGYQRLRLWRALADRLFAFVERSADTLDEGDEVLSFDVSIADETGVAVARIDGFMIRKVTEIDQRFEFVEAPTSISQEDLAASERGIRPAEGAEVLMRILARGGGPQILTATEPLAELRREYRAFDLDRMIEALDKRHVTGTGDRRVPDDASFVAPRTVAEARVAGILEELLGIERVGANDDFFELGGHSLLGVQLASRLRQTFQIELPINAIFDQPTVSGIAATIETRVAAGGETAPDMAGEIAAVAAGDDFADLSEEQVDALLLEMLSQQEA